MEVVLIVFMAFVCVFSIFSVTLVVRDIVIENADRKREREKTSLREAELKKVSASTTAEETAAPIASEKIIEVQPESANVIEEKAAKEESVDIDGNAVTFSRGASETLEEKYLALPQEYKNYYDEIVKHAALKEGSKHFKTMRYEEFKVGNTRLVRLCIKKGVVICEFILYNSDFRRLHKEMKVNVKQAPTTVKVTDAEIVKMAKDSIDIAIAAIEEEKAYKKELANERRRQQRAKKKLSELESAKDAESKETATVN